MDDLGFTWQQTKNGDVSIYHHGRYATRFSAHKARGVIEKLTRLDFAGQQQLLARLTGNYKRGNERLAQQVSAQLAKPADFQ
ncbi:MAG: hypothetical protein R3309_16055 [Reinekea sp.]|jgi:hypothetical protein|nr:hypothetical protein [Reinekea sp.]MDX1475687.1 hypothetical protein [Reinekea sp.]